MKIVFDFFIENWIVISGLVYELLARLIPTSKNWSAIDLVFKVLNFIIPNIQKKTLIILLMLLPFMGVAQLNGNFKSVRFRPAQDTATFRPKPEGTVIRSTDGNFYYQNADGFWSRLNGGLEYFQGSGINFDGQIINSGGIVTSDIVYEASIGTDFEMGTNGNPFENILGFASDYSLTASNNFNIVTGLLDYFTVQSNNVTHTSSLHEFEGASIYLNSAQLKIKDGDAVSPMGVVTLVGGTATVNFVPITNNTRIFLTHQTAVGTTIGVLYISARVPATSFTISSTSVTDNSTIAWMAVEPD